MIWPENQLLEQQHVLKKVLRGVWVWAVLHSLFYLAPDLLGHDLWKVTSLWTVTLSTYRWLFQEWFPRNASALNSFWEQHKELLLSLVGRSSRPNLRIWTCFIFLIHLNTHLHCLLPSDLMYFGKSIRWDRETEIKKEAKELDMVFFFSAVSINLVKMTVTL